MTAKFLPLLALLLVAAVHGEETNHDGHLRRGLQGFIPPSCSVQQFQTYRFGADGVAQLIRPGHHDLTDYTNGTFNDVAMVGPFGCHPPPKCVKLTLGSFHVRKELAAPYALYGDVGGRLNQGYSSSNPSGLQVLKACLYSDTACSADESGCLDKFVDIIPANFGIDPFTVTFINGGDRGGRQGGRGHHLQNPARLLDHRRL